MDSINKNQDGDHYENLSGEEAVKKIKELADGEACFFSSNLSDRNQMDTRPMAVQKIDDNGNLYFLSAIDSRKNEDISRDPAVQLFFKGSAHSDFLALHGSARITNDQKLIDELWEPMLKTWFTEGKDDPRIAAIIVTPEKGYYWDNKHGNAVALLKMAAGAIAGKTMDDSIEGEIRL